MRKKQLKEDLGYAVSTTILYGLALGDIRTLILEDVGEDSVFWGLWYARTMLDPTETPAMVEAYIDRNRRPDTPGRYSGSGVFLSTYDPYADEPLEED